ncbi:hypothetical protein CONCODRAFT_7486, partial [Conidiobolus coronatus NRRL 28638]
MFNISNLNFRKILNQALIIITTISISYMSWRALGWTFNNESPVVVVMTGSNEPTLYRGDLIFQHLDSSPFRIGELVVFRLPGRPIPIVHRILKLHVDAKTGKEFILTKGDNNPVNDRGIFDKEQLWLERKHITGRAKGYLPYVGKIAVHINDYPK